MNHRRMNLTLDTIERVSARGNGRFSMENWAKWSPTCGTTLCLAGWAATLAGDPPDFSVARSGTDNLDDVVTEYTQSGNLINEVAGRWLELDDDEQLDIFFIHVDDVAELRELLVDEYDLDLAKRGRGDVDVVAEQLVVPVPSSEE